MTATIKKNKCKAELYRGDCIEKIKEIPDNSLDAIITDPPYELGFMGKKWDGTGIAYNVELWRECLRVLKPGAHLLAFSGTRTYHRMAVAIEDAGFEIRDMLEWIYASGFPKSLNIGKAYDKKMGNEREDIGKMSDLNPRYKTPRKNAIHGGGAKTESDLPLTKGTSPYEGFGTALKPAHEPIVMARKPLSEKTIVDNVVKWGTGGIDIDGCRVPTAEVISFGKTKEKAPDANCYGKYNLRIGGNQNTQGRFPANILCTDDALNDGVMTGYKDNRVNKIQQNAKWFAGASSNKGLETPTYSDSGSKSRYFDIDVWGEKHGLLQFPKASKRERNEGCEGLPMVKGGSMTGKEYREGKPTNHPKRQNHHPTVKPVHLMSWLVRLVSKEGDVVLDPFTGSGTTGVSCLRLNRNFIGIEQDESYFEIAVKRIEA